MRYLAIAVLVGLLTGCSLVLSPPDVAVREVSVVGLDSKGVDIELYLLVTNPNPYDLRLTGYNYDLKVMALPLAKGGGRETFSFKGDGAETELRLPVRVTLRTLYELLKRGPDIERIPYQLEAGLELDTPMGSHTMPISSQGIFKVPERYRPEFYLKQLRNIVNGLVE